MKRFSVFFVKMVFALILCVGILAACNKGDKPAEDALDSDTSYAFGMLMASQLKGPMGLSELSLDYKAFMEGFKAFNESEEPRISIELAGEKIDAVFIKMQAENDEKMWLEGEKNRQDGEAYLAANKVREGVITTDSGLQYEIITKGPGKKPAATDVVRVHYEGTLIDETVFDSSYSRGMPVEFPLNQVISGWTEGVQLMSEGSVFRFVIPHDLAYGPSGSGTIPPSSTLIFKVELLSIVEQEFE